MNIAEFLLPGMPDLYREPTDSSSEAPSAPAAPLLFAETGLSSAEAEIAELEKQIAQKRALLGTEKQKPLEQIIDAEKPAPNSTAPVVALPSAAPAVAVAQAKPETQDLKNLEKNTQLKNLVDLAFQKGINYAADVARDLDNPYLMDSFHDTLIDKLHKELVERGKLEEI